MYNLEEIFNENIRALVTGAFIRFVFFSDSMNVNNVQPLRMLPRFDSHVFRQLAESVSESQVGRVLLPRFHSDHQHPFYDGNQSAEATISQTNSPSIDPHSNKVDT